jgi:hypothetical protein
MSSAISMLLGMADKFTEDLLAEQQSQADRLIEMLQKIPDLLPTFTMKQTNAYYALMDRRHRWRETLFEGQNELLKITDEEEYALRKRALIERDAEKTREMANALAAIIRNEIPE